MTWTRPVFPSPPRTGLAQRWSRDHGYGCYTSYASLSDLTQRASIFADLERAIATHVKIFARELQFELRGRKLRLDSLWINVMRKGAVHTPHIHPYSVISGTYYVTVPPRSGANRVEDPRLPMMMATPPRKAKARPENRNFVDVEPRGRNAALMGKLAAPWCRGQQRTQPAHLGQF